MNKKNYNYKYLKKKITNISLGELNNKNLLKDTVAIAASVVAKDLKIRKIVKQFQLRCAYNPPNKFFGSLLDGRDNFSNNERC